MQNERREYADKRRKGTGARLVKLPGQSGYTTCSDSPELIAKRLRVEAVEKRIANHGGR